MTKTSNGDISRISLYQKQSLCFILSEAGEEFLVELHPKRKTRGISKNSSRPSLPTTRNPSKQSEINSDLGDRGIILSPTPKARNFLEIFNRIVFSELKNICFCSLEEEEDLIERDRIIKIADQQDMAMELIAYYQRYPRDLEKLFKYLKSQRKYLEIAQAIQKASLSQRSINSLS